MADSDEMRPLHFDKSQNNLLLAFKHPRYKKTTSAASQFHKFFNKGK